MSSVNVVCVNFVDLFGNEHETHFQRCTRGRTWMEGMWLLLGCWSSLVYLIIVFSWQSLLISSRILIWIFSVGIFCIRKSRNKSGGHFFHTVGFHDWVGLHAQHLHTCIFGHPHSGHLINSMGSQEWQPVYNGSYQPYWRRYTTQIGMRVGPIDTLPPSDQSENVSSDGICHTHIDRSFCISSILNA